MTSAETPEIPRRRLHPLSPLLRSIRLLIGLIAYASWRALSDFGVSRFIMGIAVGIVVVTAFSIVSWRFTGYEVARRELRIYEGVLSRRTRTIPLERLQSVEVVRPFLAQVLGLAELRLEVVGGGKAEAPLAYLSVAEAGELRTRLLALSRGAHPAEAETAAVPEAPLHAVDNNNLLLSQLFTPEVWAVPIAVAFVVFQFVSTGRFGFIAIASTFTALIGVFTRPIRRLTRNWDFKLTTSEGKLHLHRGLTEKISQVVPVHRVQAIQVVWPLLWRPKQWVRVGLDIATHGAQGGEHEELGTLLPVGDAATARAIVPYALPGVDIAALPLTGVPEQAKWVAPLGRRVLAAGLTDQVFATVDGVLTRSLTLVPYARIQSVRVSQGPVQRRLGLATLHVDHAGGLAARAPERTVAEAYALAAQLTERARLARAAAQAL
ncbi:putative membrane protein [Allocatelliglobosispora scoriae]|uniref:Putative membrane protein n=1 Tax=Allocatelliglobosispora scoriae TaxID=643052 RepID=A0A841BPU0_9ACTN|nr:PH domain-containing protein [Allocatelliglobosispora scoriae]MBB5869209.1 putative membrane protein [Allocatelliglobosispora scoriae]